MNKEKRTWRIYKYENKINGKVYIGQTKNSLAFRAKGGSNYKGCPYFYNAIKYYGWSNFVGTILVDNILTKEEADRLEKKYIQKYKSCNKKYGYNVDFGGNSFSYAQLLSKRIYQYDLKGNFLNDYSSILEAEFATGINCSCIVRVASNERKSAGGYIWSYKKFNKVPEYFFKTKTSKVYQYDLLGNYVNEYNNSYEAGIQFGKHAAHRIIKHCDSEKGECFNYQWRYYKIAKLSPVAAYGGHKKAVYQYDMDGILIGIYSSATIAADKYKVGRNAIAGCCRGLCKTICGYYWSYNYMPKYIIE